jgi:DNA-binding HxlR family transcriptional regulator
MLVSTHHLVSDGGKTTVKIGGALPKKFRRTYNCPTEFAIDVLGGKWKTVILAYLKERPMRYSELRKLLPELSDKVLTDRLRDLGDAGLVVRRKATRSDVYVLSARGESLRAILSGLYEWGLLHAQAFGVHVDAPLDRLRATSTKQPLNAQ